LVVAWVGSYLAFMVWLHSEMSQLDFATFTGVYIVCLPLISQRRTPAFMAWIGGPVYGLITGLQLIDLVFDLVILRNVTLSDGMSVFDGKRVAYLYYHTMLNASHVNGVLLAVILVCSFGSCIGLGRSLPQARKQWLIVGACVAVGTSGYLVSVVTRYLRIRSAAAFDASLFDGWEMVLVARLQLYASLLVSMPFLFRISTQLHQDQDQDARSMKTKEQ